MLDHPPGQDPSITAEANSATTDDAISQQSNQSLLRWGSQPLILPGFRLALGAGLAGLVLALLAAMIWLRAVDAEYTATIVVGPTAQAGLVGMGLRIPAGTANDVTANPMERRADEVLTDFEHFRQLLVSPVTAMGLAKDEAAMRALRFNLWKAEASDGSGHWVPAGSAWHHRLADWIRGVDAGDSPGNAARYIGAYGDDGVHLSQWLSQEVSIVKVGETALYRLSLRHRDRDVAIATLSWLTDQADALLRAEARRRVAVQIDHLTTQMARADLASHREALSRLLTQELQLSMMLAVDLPFARDVIEQVTAPRRPDWPAVLPMLGVSALFGLFAGLGLAIALKNRGVDE
ncbi:MAG: hypothetical protein KI792_02600 [Alphaproteobacteria bacterium]|nr:hypothetical protein [Alphaproteobacteria bacterium SS10]